MINTEIEREAEPWASRLFGSAVAFGYVRASSGEYGGTEGGMGGWEGTAALFNF